MCGKEDFMDVELRFCLRDPILEIHDAARYLDAAVSAHLNGNAGLAEELIHVADMPAIREWTESIWGAKSQYVKKANESSAYEHLGTERPGKGRMPNTEQKRALLVRDGYHCRFCGIPVIRMEVRQAIRSAYPNALPWGARNEEQHAAFQAMWVQYDHLIPYSRGGSTNLENLIITCAPCNYGRADKLLNEVGLADPRDRDPIRSQWDGLERFVRRS